MTKICDKQSSNWSGHPHTCMQLLRQRSNYLFDWPSYHGGLIPCQMHPKEGVEVICVYMLYSWILNAREAVLLTDLVYKHEERI